MDLLVDIGNTNLKWAIRASDGMEEMRVVRHHGALPIDLHAALEQLPAPRRVLAASVAGQSINDAFVRTCRSHWKLEPEFVRTERTCRGVTVAYAEPERLGVDRWVGLIAAHGLCSGPILVVDAGTAVTYDLLLPDGHHLGGLILPGIEMMHDGLLAGTRIPHVEPDEFTEPWATDTVGAVAAGSVQALAALAERLVGRLEKTSGSTPTLLMTGGDTERLLPALGVPARVEPDLVLQGLALLFN